MCGIAGFLGIQNDSLLREMLRMISHRGPDDEGVFSEDQIGLGHRRLSVIDLSRLGQQPMKSMDGNAIISYNGEIYNFKQLKKELIQLGHTFRSATDTEVALNAYLAWGENCLERFNGMFALAIWDRRSKTLLLARDRLGIKPFYFSKIGNILIFASEIKSILCWNRIRREVNTRALDYYFTFRYNHLEETLFKNIFKLPPAHYMLARLESNGSLHTHLGRFWDVSAGTVHQSEKSLTGLLAEKILSAVDYQMVSDVPLGTFLSSGVDSSSITAVMKNRLGKPTKTFTVGFGYPGFGDELRPVRFTTRYLQTEHTEYICKPDVVSIIPKVIWHADELNADPALIPTYLISEIARRKVKVVLSGEGSDELFGGYERTLMMLYAWQISRFSPALVQMVPGLIGMIPVAVLDKIFKYTSSVGSKGMRRLSSFCNHIHDIGASYIDVACVFNQNEKKALYGPRLKHRLAEENIAESINRQFFGRPVTTGAELFHRLSYFELTTRLPNDLLAKVDSMTMAHSLEARVPFLDHNLVEFAFSIPHRLKMKHMREKYILRKAALDYLPREIVKRRKDNFFVPIHLWLQNELRPTVDRILSRRNLSRSGYLNPDFILSAYKNYKKGALFYARQIWNILFFLIWHRMYIETDCFLNRSQQPVSFDDLFV